MRSLQCIYGFVLHLLLLSTTMPQHCTDAASQIPLITKVTIVSSSIGSPIRQLVTGDTINLAITGSNISMVATANNFTNSVRFGLNGNAKFRVDSAVPYSLTGDAAQTSNGGTFLPWSPAAGVYNLTVQAFTLVGAKGVGTQVVFRFAIVNQPITTFASPTKRPTARPTAPPSSRPPTKLPTAMPSQTPSQSPSQTPSQQPSNQPSIPVDTAFPTSGATLIPSANPFQQPSIIVPTLAPSIRLQVPIPPTTTTVAPTRSPSNSNTLQNSVWLPIPTTRNPTARNECCFVMVGNLAYLVGGRGIVPVDVYDPTTQNWLAPRPGLGQEIHHTQCVVIGTDIWIVSAWTGPYPYEFEVPFIYIFDTVNSTWSQLPGLPESRRRGAAAVVYHPSGKIYVSHGNRGGHAPNSTTLPWLDMYDVASGNWTILPDAPHARDHTGGAILGNLFCVAGGRNGTAGFKAVILPTDCFNLDTQKWEVKPNIGQGRAGSAYGQLCDGRLMVAGGEGFGKAWNNVDVFDGFVWTSAPSLNISRHATGLAISCACNQVFIASGSIAQGSTLTATTETLFSGGLNVPCQ